ncbi:hypothetical protein [Micromonospora deserti]|uniref:hypothetical protein n=1 Tax=Micromonospora deserti TaxID=2070366 RepID=UPI000DA8097D|nr:hypothetical protein [Micromonospora deserti]
MTRSVSAIDDHRRFPAGRGGVPAPHRSAALRHPNAHVSTAPHVSTLRRCAAAPSGNTVAPPGRAAATGRRAAHHR